MTVKIITSGLQHTHTHTKINNKTNLLIGLWFNIRLFFKEIFFILKSYHLK